MLLTDLLKGVGLYFDGRDPVNVFGLIREEDATAKTVRQGTVLIGIDDGGTRETDDHFFIG